MAKEKTKIVTLEGTTAISNKELIWWLEKILSEERGPVEGIGRVFTLTQKPRVQVAQQPKEKKA